MVKKKEASAEEASTSEGVRLILDPGGEEAEAPPKAEEALTAGTLTIRYVNDTPEITVTGGTGIPGEIVVVDAQGNPVALYTGSALPDAPHAESHGRFLPAGHKAVVPVAVPILSDRALKRDVVGVVWE
ncbi:hypothetical protein ACIRU3_39000 [Streptomyces sp. NPDC101151]|uniref:hypothetical protein n=1 Tax=Streptomyces sp. NPDC101151 TaxID=3366115 RepID=UPI003812E48E